MPDLQAGIFLAGAINFNNSTCCQHVTCRLWHNTSGKTEGDLVILECYMEGEFVKYINNDGHICKKGSEVADKAEAFPHFIYVKSEKQTYGSGHPRYWILII